MDPQKLSQLDPKLRDAYQRVMGASVPQPPPPSTPPPAKSDLAPAGGPTPAPQQPPTQPTPPAQPPMPEPQPIPTPQPTMPEPQPSIPQPQPPTPQPIPQQPPVQATKFDQMNSTVAAAQTSPNLTAPAPQPQTIPVNKKKSNLMPILIGIAILVFIAVYAFFWTKIFNFKLPFLP